MTAQGVYKALRKLKREEVITVHGKMVSLSLIWIERQIAKYSGIAQTYQTARRENYFLQLHPGEHVAFKFKTLRELDLFWTHAFVLLEAQTKKELPMYAVVPHDWFSSLRPESDKIWSKKLRESARPQGVVITHPTKFDKGVVVERRSTTKQLEFVLGENPFHQDEREYLNVIGQWIFAAKIDNAINRKLVAWINDGQSSSRGVEEFGKILGSIGTHRLKIIHSPRRAETLSKKLKKYFTFKA